MYLKIIISGLLLVLLAVNVVPEEEKPKGFIGYGGGFEWNIEKSGAEEELEVEYKINDETSTEFCIKIKNKTTYENGLIDKDISNIPITILNGTFNINKSKIDFSGEELEIEECFIVSYDELVEGMEFKIGWDSILIGASTSSLANSYNEKIVKDSTGRLHLLWKDSLSDIQYANSSDNGITWTTKELKDTQTVDFLNLVINSTDGLWAIWGDTSGRDIWHTTSSDYGVTWSIPAIITDFEGNATHQFDGVSAVMDDYDNVHICVTTREWGDDPNGDFLLYSNYSDGGWSGLTWVNQNSTDDSDTCDIETDSNGVVYIVASGSDDDCVDLWTSTGTGWGGSNPDNRYEIHTDYSDSKVGIYINKNDKIVVAFETDATDLGFSNSTPSSATTNWDYIGVDLDSSANSDIKITDNGDIYILYDTNIIDDKDIFKAFWNSTDGTWTKRVIVVNVTWQNPPFPSMRGSRIGSDTITDRIDYTYWNDTDNSYYFDYFNVTAPPPDTTPPTYSNFVKNITDADIISDSAIQFNNTITDAENNVAYWNFSWNCTVGDNWQNITNSTVGSSSVIASANHSLSRTVGDVCGYMFCSADTQTPENKGCDSVRTFEIQEPIVDTCSPTSPLTADYGFDASDNCVITSDLDVGGYNIACYGTGTLNLNAVISNFDNVFIHTGCNLYCRNTPSCFE